MAELVSYGDQWKDVALTDGKDTLYSPEKAKAAFATVSYTHLITEEGYDEVMGVRPLRRVVEQQIRDKVTDFHLDHLDAKHLEADMKDGVLVIREKA